MTEVKSTTFSLSLIWFGAAVSMAEIVVGTLFAPLGFAKGFAAIVIGHIIGGFLLYLAGLMGALTQKSAMDTVKTAFGDKGAILFSALNIVQLVGWTAVMIVTGIVAANALWALGDVVWGIILGGLIFCWIFIGLKNVSKINVLAMTLLFILTLALSLSIFQGTTAYVGTTHMPFGVAIELSAIMPLSWLPLIADYTRRAQNPIRATRFSVGVYLLGSTWMYSIGLGAALFTAQSDLGQILLNSGLGVFGLIIVLFSTTTTTLLDVHSAGVSAVSVWKKLSETKVAVAVCILGTILAIFTPIREYESFLYFIGSVFAPMAAVLITNFFLLKQDYQNKNFAYLNLGVWLAGFVFYRYLKTLELGVGTTLPAIAVTMLLCFIVNKMPIFRNKNS